MNLNNKIKITKYTEIETFVCNQTVFNFSDLKVRSTSIVEMN